MTRRGGRVVASVLGAAAIAAACTGPTLVFPSEVKPTVLVKVSPEIDLDAGIDGSLQETLATGIQTAPWQQAFFSRHLEEDQPDASPLIALGAGYVRVQAYDPSLDGGVWDFTELDETVGPLLKLNEPVVLQILSDDSLNRSAAPTDDASIESFARYCAKMVAYYNSDAGLVLDDGGTLRSDGGRPILWWSLMGDLNDQAGMLDEPLLGAQYAQVYSRSVAAMLAVDPRLKFAGPEFSDCTEDHGQCSVGGGYIQSFLAAIADAGPDGSRVPLDALSVHMFSASTAIAWSDNGGQPGGFRASSDPEVWATVPPFESDIRALRELLSDAGRNDVPVWVTQSQVNSDTPSNHNPPWSNQVLRAGANIPFRADDRGTAAFFAAWRPYMFARLGKAGGRALFQWQFTAGQCELGQPCSIAPSAQTDNQNGEVMYFEGTRLLSYWVDYALAHDFPGDAGLSILQASMDPASASTDAATAVPDTEILAVRRGDGQRTVMMVVNHAADDAVLYNGPGAPSLVTVDFSALVANAGGNWSVSKLVIDGTTDPDAGPTELTGAGVPPGQTFVPIAFDGYGVAFLTVCTPRCDE